MSTLFAFLHHVAAFTLVGALVIEFILIGQVAESGLSLGAARRLMRADAVLGAAAVILLAVGLSRVFFFEKGADYYFHSHAFLTKLAVFIVVALFSIVPTVEFLRWRKLVEVGEVPAVDVRKLLLVKRIIHGELAAIVVILLCAAVMAHGGFV